MNLFKSQLFQEAPRPVAGPYRQSFGRRYGRRVERRQGAGEVCRAAHGIERVHVAVAATTEHPHVPDVPTLGAALLGVE